VRNFLIYSPPNIRMIKLRRMGWIRHVAYMNDTRNAYKVLVRKHVGKRPLETSRHRWEDNIKTGVKYVRRLWTVCIWLRLETSGGLL
jgi:hypothetical protein